MKYFKKSKVKLTDVSLDDNSVQVPGKIEISKKMHKDRVGKIFAPLSKKEVKNSEAL